MTRLQKSNGATPPVNNRSFEVAHVDHLLAANATTFVYLDAAHHTFFHTPPALATVLGFIRNCGVKTSLKAFAHNVYPDRSYDGLLVSRAYIDGIKGVWVFNRKALKKTLKKTNAPSKVWKAFDQWRTPTIHNMLAYEPGSLVMGDCGAFSFVNSKEPPFSTSEIVEYYTKYEFTQGVSVDHLILDFVQDKQFRYDLTIANAEAFIKEHKKLDLRWTPIGSIQGWNVGSYAKAAGLYARMGYKYLAIGGIIKSKTEYILRILQGIRDELTRVGHPEVVAHLFGVTRFMSLPEFGKLGAKSFDSTSLFVRSFRRGEESYLLESGWKPVITLPVQGQHVKAVAEEGTFDRKVFKAKSKKLLVRVLKFAASGETKPPKKLLNDLVAFNILAYPAYQTKARSLYRRFARVFKHRYWEQCPCRICKLWGVKVALTYSSRFYFARGIHNLFMFHHILYPQIEAGKEFPFFRKPEKGVYMSPLFELPLETSSHEEL